MSYYKIVEVSERGKVRYRVVHLLPGGFWAATDGKSYKTRAAAKIVALRLENR